MRILVANANTTEAITETCAAAARAAAATGTEIRAATSKFGAETIGTRVENAIAAHALLECLAEHHTGCDAVILAVSYDTALDAARQLLPIPVLGMTEAACYVACSVATRFGLVSFNQPHVYEEVVRGHGLSARCTGVSVAGGAPTDVFTDPAGTTARILEACRRAVADGAEAVVLGGAAMAGLTPKLQPQLPVPVLDGMACATVLAEAMVRLGLPRSTAGTLAVPRRATIGLAPSLTAMLRGA